MYSGRDGLETGKLIPPFAKNAKDGARGYFTTAIVGVSFGSMSAPINSKAFVV